MEAERAKERQLANLKRGDALPDRKLVPQREAGKAADKAGAMVGVSGNTRTAIQKTGRLVPNLEAIVLNRDALLKIPIWVLLNTTNQAYVKK